MLGKNVGLWSDLVKHISTAYGVPGILSFGGLKYGWELGFRKGGRPLADLYPADGYFVAQVVLGKAATSMAGQLRLGDHVREVFDGSRQLYDGRWLFIPVKSKRDVEDVKLLIDVKVTSR
jgi:hypothetical protein